MSDLDLVVLIADLKARAAQGRDPIILRTPAANAEDLRLMLLRLDIPQSAFIVAPLDEPPSRVRPEAVAAAALAALRAAESIPARDPYRLARAVHAKADELLDRYRQPNPEAAARYRAERAAKIAARAKAKP